MIWNLNVTECMRADTLEEVLELREKMNNAMEYDLQSFQYTVKFDKSTEEEYYVVKAKKIINKEKDPERVVNINYEY